MKEKKHLTLRERNKIQGGLANNKTFKQIGLELEKVSTTVAREVKQHMYIKKKGAKFSRFFNDCIYRKTCTKKFLCDDLNCLKERCSLCSKCNYICPDYTKEQCPRMEKALYVCNGCEDKAHCQLEKRYYESTLAQYQYKEVLKSHRDGIAINEDEMNLLNDLICPLMKKGQSLHHIYTNNKDVICIDERTLYNYVEAGLLDVNNFDLIRQVRYKKRINTNRYKLKIDKKCYQGRTYKDYQEYIKEHPGVPVVEIDSVEGLRDETEAILTVHFVNCALQLGFFRKHNNSKSVIDAFNCLYERLGYEDFTKLFPIFLTDRGCEFSNPKELEIGPDGRQRAKVFFCDPMCSWQKSQCERNHELMRYIIPKKNSIAFLNQEKTELMMNTINNYTRKQFGNNTPYQMFKFIYGSKITKKLGIKYITPNDILLKPSLIR